MEKYLSRRVISEPFVHLLYDYLESLGLSPENVLQLPRPKVKPDSSGNFPLERWITLLDRAASYLQDPTLGLKLGQTIMPRHGGVLGYLLLASHDLGDALQRLDRYQHLLYAVTPMERRFGSGYIDLVWGVEQGRPGPLVGETAITALVQFCRHITGQRLRPCFVHFINPIPLHQQPYTDYFGCPVQFAQPETVLRIDAAALALPLRTADPGIIGIMESYADKLLAKLPLENTLLHLTREAIAGCLHDGESNVDAVAAKLGRTRRSLQRNLGALGSSFRDELNAVRKEMALRYLGHAHLGLLDIAMLLGYSEQSAFSRSFKQWTGISPNAYRRNGCNLHSLVDGLN